MEQTNAPFSFYLSWWEIDLLAIENLTPSTCALKAEENQVFVLPTRGMYLSGGLLLAALCWTLHLAIVFCCFSSACNLFHFRMMGQDWQSNNYCYVSHMFFFQYEDKSSTVKNVKSYLPMTFSVYKIGAQVGFKILLNRTQHTFFLPLRNDFGFSQATIV